MIDTIVQTTFPPKGSAQVPLAALVEAELRKWVTGGRDLLDIICSEALFPSGKLLRPVVCLESAAAVGGDIESIVPFAAGLECIHVSSLIHDDILDNDALRRGRESTARRHGIDDAILAGDGLVAYGVMAMLSCHERGVPADRLMAATKGVCRAVKEMCRAALLEATLRGDLSIDQTLSAEVIRGKTAVLIQCACAAGGILSGASAEQVEVLGRYGEELGMAFQMRDDLLPYISDTSAIGKAVTSDVTNLHPTLPVLVAYASAEDGDRRRLEEIFATGTDSVSTYREIRELVIRTGAVAEVTRRARSHATRAREALAALPPSDSRERLAKLIATAAV